MGIQKEIYQEYVKTKLMQSIVEKNVACHSSSTRIKDQSPGTLGLRGIQARGRQEAACALDTCPKIMQIYNWEISAFPASCIFPYLENDT